ncbi:MAG: flagellar basal body L-ring protein FlgH [Planctomycetaceae bacterium]|jgi:flagellar L-ring protein precursor FlgH|nr:flagellar basal body L-ring protein FlgH [Planctomycetaceae bacterium]
MLKNVPFQSRFLIYCLCFYILFIASDILAQSGSLGGSTALTPRKNGRPLKMAEASLTWESAPRQKVYKEQEIIHVHYKQNWNYNNVANNQRKKSIKTSAKISGWFKWPDLFSMPVKSDASLPEIGGELDHKTQNQGNLLRKETLDFDISCHVTSIQDNGNLFIEGTFSSNIGEEGKIMYISGYIRPEDIGPGNTIESNKIDDLVYKEIPSGSSYDAVRRTWGARLIEHWKPL